MKYLLWKHKNVNGLRTITYYVDTWTSGADIQKLRDWER